MQYSYIYNIIRVLNTTQIIVNYKKNKNSFKADVIPEKQHRTL